MHFVELNIVWLAGGVIAAFGSAAKLPGAVSCSQAHATAYSWHHTSEARTICGNNIVCHFDVIPNRPATQWPSFRISLHHSAIWSARASIAPSEFGLLLNVFPSAWLSWVASSNYLFGIIAGTMHLLHADCREICLDSTDFTLERWFLQAIGLAVERGWAINLGGGMHHASSNVRALWLWPKTSMNSTITSTEMHILKKTSVKAVS